MVWWKEYFYTRLCVCVPGGDACATCMLSCVGQRTTFRSQFSPFTMRVLGIEPRSLGLAESTFTGWTISPDLMGKKRLKEKVSRSVLVLIQSGFLPFLNPGFLTGLDLWSCLESFQWVSVHTMNKLSKQMASSGSLCVAIKWEKKIFLLNCDTIKFITGNVSYLAIYHKIKFF